MLTDEQRAVLAHVVVDPDAWYAHAVACFGRDVAAKHLSAKTARWKPLYDKACKAGGYKSRSEREAEELKEEAK